MFSIVLAGLLLAGCSGSEGTAGAPPQAQAGAGNVQAPSVPVLLQNRHVIRNGEILVRVADVQKSEAKVSSLVEGLGGYIDSSTSSGYGTPGQQVVMSARVPSQKFGQAIAEITLQGTLLSKSTSSEDATEQVIDIEQRLKSLRRKEERLRAILDNRGTVSDVLAASKAVEDVRTEIETIEAKRVALASLTNFSTIEITLTQDASAYMGPADKGWFMASWSQTLAAAEGTWRTLVAAGMVALVYSPLWLAIVGIVVWLNKLGRRRPASPGSGPTL